MLGAGLAVALALPAAAAEDDAALAKPVGVVAEGACRIVDSAAHAAHLPAEILTRLVWTESRFRAGAISPAGAQGIAQFLPETAAARGLVDPFDPEQAIPLAAAFLAELDQRFGNIGLAAAAYNAGPGRVAGWLAGSGSLPQETETYVLTVTGRSAGDWASAGRHAAIADGPADGPSCMEVTAALRTEGSADPPPIAPWGVQLAGNFSKPAALAAFERARQHSFGIIGDLPPMVIGTVLRSRGTRPFYRVMVPAATRAEADRLCQTIAARGGSCVALRS